MGVKEGRDQARPYVELGDDADAAILGVRDEISDVRLKIKNRVNLKRFVNLLG